ncbi:hypothetical protein ACN4EG_15010 [Alkalinema pantanalense CENA528]|uniref:hypothetical protein n=1 Tax=Alkalinema pantanalense TaxID=1620705 RepID=UPI003D6E0158
MGGRPKRLEPPRTHYETGWLDRMLKFSASRRAGYTAWGLATQGCSLQLWVALYFFGFLALSAGWNRMQEEL